MKSPSRSRGAGFEGGGDSGVVEKKAPRGGEEVGVVLAAGSNLRLDVGEPSPGKPEEELCKVPGRKRAGASVFLGSSPSRELENGVADIPPLGTSLSGTPDNKKSRLSLVDGSGDGLLSVFNGDWLCGANNGFEPRSEGNMLLLVVPVKFEKGVIAGTPAEPVGLLELAGAKAGDGETKRLGLGWVGSPLAVSATGGNIGAESAAGGNIGALFPPNGPGRAGFCSPSAAKEIFGGGAIPFTAAGGENDGKPP